MKTFALPRPITDDEILPAGTVLPCAIIHSPTSALMADADKLPIEKLKRVAQLVDELRDDFEHINLLPHGEFARLLIIRFC
jgi:hypothetical protein